MRGLLLALLVAVIFNVVTSQILKVGFAYTSPREDVSWTYAIENARQQIENDYPEVFTEWTVINNYYSKYIHTCHYFDFF